MIEIRQLWFPVLYLSGREYRVPFVERSRLWPLWVYYTVGWN